MYTTINTTTMEPVVTTRDLKIAETWAETIPYQNDFAVVTHQAKDFAPYSMTELRVLHARFAGNKWRTVQTTDRVLLVTLVLEQLDMEPVTSEPPPDEKRVAPLATRNEENEMAIRKKAASKKPAPITKPKGPSKATKKVATKKVVAPKVVTPKVERERKNGVLTPKPESNTGRIFAIADALSKKAGAPAKRADVVEAGVANGIKLGTATAAYQIWRNYHGLVKSAA